MDEDNCVNNCNDKSWFNKYKPTKTSELVGNKKSINLIITWLQNFEANKEKYVINDTVKSSKKKKTVAKVENTSDEVNVSKLSKGIYILKTYINNSVGSQKFIKE